MKHFNMNTAILRTSALLLALMLCMTAFGCSNVRSVSNDKQNSLVAADKMSKDSSISERVTETPEPTAEPTPEPTAEPTPEPKTILEAVATYGQIPSGIPAALPEPDPTYDYEQMILDFFGKINKGDFLGLAKSFAPVMREERVKAVNEWNEEHKYEFYNFKHVDVLGIAKINERYCRPDAYFTPELNKMLSNTDDFDCYYVHTNVDVHEYFPDDVWRRPGERGFVVTVVKQDGEWYIANVGGYSAEHSLEPSWMEYIDNFYDNMDK